MSRDVPVLICGAGPTGMTLALELARFGVPFRIVERASHGAEYSQALAVQARTLELLEAAHLTDRLLACANRVEHVRLQAGSHQLVAADFAGMPTPYPFVAMIPQRETERVMREALAALGVRIEREITLTSLAAAADGVDVELAGPRGIERVRTRFLAGCDGAHSTVRHLLDLRFDGHALPERFALADVTLETTLPTGTLHVFLSADGGAVALFPMRDFWRIIVESPDELPEPPAVERFQAAIDGQNIPARILTQTWMANYHVHQRRVEHVRSGNAFLLGDAAHIHSPIGGQGMNSGIGDAVNLAWKLALVVRDGVDPLLLDTFADEREAVGRALLAATDYGNRVAFNANTMVRALRNAVLPVATHLPLVTERLRENVAQLRIAYPHSRLSVNGSPARRGLRAGMRVPGARPAGYRPQTIVLHPKDQAAAITLVLRPDGYAGYVSDGAHAGGAVTYLRNVIGLRPAADPAVPSAR
jgi:2-polyprenyl-6-methoxyphenol hydroxylase-like FAD-dependent oxidoreductase